MASLIVFEKNVMDERMDRRTDGYIDYSYNIEDLIFSINRYFEKGDFEELN